MAYSSQLGLLRLGAANLGEVESASGPSDGVAVADSLDNWHDLVPSHYSVEAFDSMFYNIFDELTYGSSLTNLISSDSMSLSDSFNSRISNSLFVVDSFTLADSIILSLLSSRAFADSMSMSDSLLMRSNLILGVSDSLNFWLDVSGSSGPAINLGRSVTDTLNFWSDSVNGLSSTSETNYLRQYLNDVIN